MFTTGSKLYFGISVIALIAAIVHGVTSDWESFALVILLTLAAAASFVGGVVIAFRDADVPATVGAATSAADAEGVVSSSIPASRQTVSLSPWPTVAGFGLGVLILGWVLDSRLFLAGVFVLAAVTIEWMVKAWSDRASGDPVYNKHVRDQLMHPFEFPLAAAVGGGIVVLGMSRVLLALSRDGSTIVFIAFGSLILLVGILLSLGRSLSSNVISGLLLLGGIAVIAGGVVGAAVGEREFHHVEPEESDATQFVSNRADACVRLTLEDGQFNVTEAVIPRAITCKILFENADDGVESRLVVEAEEGEFATIPDEGPVEQLLLVRIDSPGEYEFHAEGTDARGTLRVQ